MNLKKYIPFKIRYDLQDRQQKFKRFLAANTQQSIALIIQPLKDSKLHHFDNCKFAIDKQKTLNYLKSMLNSKFSLDANKNCIYLFVGKKMLHEGNMKMGQLYEKYKDSDGFMYINYAENNPF